MKLILSLSTLFGLGKSPIMPGTIGAFFGTLFSFAAISSLKTFPAVFLSILLILFAIVICDVAEKEMQIVDPGCIVLDEFVAMPICFFGVRNIISSQIPTWEIFAIGFIIFRIFDIIKPFGIKKIQNLSGGIGIVADDILAAVYTNISLIIICICLTVI